MIHQTAEVHTKLIGNNTLIWQNVVILEHASIGQDCNINAFCFIENDVVIGNNVTIKCGVYIWDGVSVEDDVFIGPNVTFVNDYYPRSKKYPDSFLKTVIKKGATIGANATILGGLNIGEYSFVGAGSVLTKDVPPYELWYGNPAKHKGFVCKCGSKLDKNRSCKKCKI